MSKLRALFAIPCLALSMALVGCGGGESEFTPVETAEPAPTEDNYMGGVEPEMEPAGSTTPAADPAEPAAPEGGSGEG